MKVEGVKKWHLGLSSILYVFVIYDSLISPMDIPNHFVASIYITRISPLVLFFMGPLFLIYYLAKREELMAKVLAVSNMIPFILIVSVSGGLIYSYLFIGSLLLFFFTLDLYVSRDKTGITEKKVSREEKGETKTKINYCSKCGTKISAGDKFCSNCDAKL